MGTHTPAFAFDRYGVIQKLQRHGFTLDQAEGVAAALTSADFSELATKADLTNAIKDLELRLYKHIAGILIAHGLGTAALTVALLQLLR